MSVVDSVDQLPKTMDRASSKEIEPGVARVLWMRSGFGGKEYGVIGVRDSGESGGVVYLPFIGQDHVGTLKRFGYDRVEAGNLSRAERQRIIDGCQRMPPILAVDAVLNAGEIGFDSYQQPDNGLPRGIIGVVGEPGAGKTWYLALLWATNPDEVISFKDGDPYSPTSFSQVKEHLMREGVYVNDQGIPIGELLEAQLAEFYDLQSTNNEWQKPNIYVSELLEAWRQEYKGAGFVNQAVMCQGELLERCSLVDLPGVKTDRMGNIVEERQLDAVDMLQWSMQTMEVIRDLVYKDGKVVGPEGRPMIVRDSIELLMSGQQEMARVGSLYELEIREFIWAMMGDDIKLERGLGGKDDRLGVLWQKKKSQLRG